MPKALLVYDYQKVLFYISLYGPKFNTATKQTRGIRNVVPMEDTRILMDRKKKSNKIKPLIIIRKRHATFFRREKLEHLVTTGMFDGKRSTGKQREKMDGLINWPKVSRVTNVRKGAR